MKFFYVFFIFIANSCFGQQWQADVMAGVSGYNGDLTQNPISLKTLGPALNLNVKCFFPGNFLGIRFGLMYGRISGNDKNNVNPSINVRNLNFKTHLLEGSVGAELNLLDPVTFNAYPYLYAGVGLLHFDPYTYDRLNNKIYLRSLGTEGQGLPEYPDRKMYSLTQFVIPLAVGWKWRINESYEIGYEFGVRYTFTDYLDDVSTTYADPVALQAERGRVAVELAYRQTNPPVPVAGQKRGNPKVKDFYYITGFKIVVNLNAREE